MKKLILIAVMCLFSGLVISEEIVINKDGNPVLLKDDNTWVLMDTSGDDGKVIFTITNGRNYFSTQEKKNDLGDFDHWRLWAGCEYTLTIENKTKFPIQLSSPQYIATTNRDLFNVFESEMEFRNVVKAGEKYVGEGTFDKGKIGIYRKIEAEEPPTKDEKNKLKNKLMKEYGCQVQSGTIYLAKKSYSKFIVFSKKANIATNAIMNFIKTSQTGVYPLMDKIRIE